MDWKEFYFFKSSQIILLQLYWNIYLFDTNDPVIHTQYFSYFSGHSYGNACEETTSFLDSCPIPIKQLFMHDRPKYFIEITRMTYFKTLGFPSFQQSQQYIDFLICHYIVVS